MGVHQQIRAGFINQFVLEIRTLDFLDLVVFFQFAIWLPVIALNISPFQFIFEDLGLSYEMIYLPFAVLIYWIGIKWFSDSPTLTFKSVTKRFIERRVSPLVIESCLHDLGHRVRKYEVYRHTDVTIGDLAHLVQVSEHTITYLLHQELGQTFEDYIESIRVELLLRKATDPDSDASFESIALSVGFQSAEAGEKAIGDYTALSKSEIVKLTGAQEPTDED